MRSSERKTTTVLSTVPDLIPRPAVEFDYIIIGSGVAGTTVAYELLKKHPKLQVLMLEAGPVSTLKDRRLWWNYVRTGIHPYSKDAEDEHYIDKSAISTGRTPMEIKGSRLLTYGGSTVHWGGWSLRMKREDFKLFSNTGRGIDWPITYSHLEDFYNRAEQYLAVSGTTAEGGNQYNSVPPFPFAPSDNLMIEGFKSLNCGATVACL
ncbi:MAG: FAD-dependent oxidoreductase [Gammaproteobacteria bacterium]|nr:FAD-dependent oxidoreductase [Gammaproteobacteria bacterium]